MNYKRKLSQLLVVVAAVVLASSCGAPAPQATPGAGPQSITFHRFFEDCRDKYAGVTDPWKAEDECGGIEILANKWNAEHADTPVNTFVVGWLEYYTRLSADIAAGIPPNVSVMHANMMQRYAATGALLPLDELFAEYGIDVNDFVPAARAGATFGGKLYALPWDIHTYLWQINVDLFKEAGLVDQAGAPILPKNELEFLAQAAQMKERTGKEYVMAEDFIWEMGLFTPLVWQQGGDYFDAEGKPTMDTPEAARALGFMKELLDGGYSTIGYDSPGAWKHFLDGESATLISGTWDVRYMDVQVSSGNAAFKTLKIVPFPTIYDVPADLAGSHMWVLPAASNRDPAQVALDMKFLKFLYDNNASWALTGHFPARISVQESDQYKALPHRQEYAGAAEIAHQDPAVSTYPAWQTVIHEEVAAVSRGQKSISEGLASMQSRMEEFVRMAGGG